MLLLQLHQQRVVLERELRFRSGMRPWARWTRWRSLRLGVRGRSNAGGGATDAGGRAGGGVGGASHAAGTLGAVGNGEAVVVERRGGGVSV